MGKNKAKGKRRSHSTPVDTAAMMATLPQVDALHDVPTFADMHIDDAQRAAHESFCAALAATDAQAASEMHMGCVVRLDRGFPLVATAERVFRAEHAVSFAKGRSEGERLLPAVGDVVTVRLAPGHDMGVIERVLPRRTSFERWRGKNRGERQVLAANVDTIFIVQPLGASRDTSALVRDRIARSLVLAYDCGAEPVVNMRKPLSRGMASQVPRFLPGPALYSGRSGPRGCSLVVARLAS